MKKDEEGIGRFDRLRREGWTRQFVANEPRLSESVELYEESGYEVRLEALPRKAECPTCEGESGEGECRICFEGFEDQYKIIFTRPKRTEKAEDDDLY
jgi:hypothetical protein